MTDQTTAYPAGMDIECIPLCDALNALPGIRTFESCCGHGRGPFRVFLTAESLKDLRQILVPLSAGTPWRLEANWANGGNIIYFILEAENPSPEAMEWLIGALANDNR